MFHGIYDQQTNKNKAGKIVLAFFIIAGAITIIVSGVTTFKNLDKSNPSNIIKFNIGNEYAVNLFKNNNIKYTEILKIISKITSINLEYQLNNITDIISYHELLEIKINETFTTYDGQSECVNDLPIRWHEGQ